MTVTVNPDAQQRGRMVIKIEGVAATTGGGIGAVLNPEGVTLMILRSQLYIDTASTGAANLSAGVAAAATTSATDLINALAMNGSIAGKVYNGNTIQTTAKTEITAPIPWTSTGYITFTGSATTVGLVAYLFVEYIRLTA